MVNLAHARLAPLPAILTAAARRNLDSPYRLGLQHGLRWEGLDGEVLEAMIAALRRSGRPETVEIEAALAAAGAWQDAQAEAGSDPGAGAGSGPGAASGLDLARGARFLAEPLARFYPEAMDLRDLPGRAFLRCPWPETGFWLPARAAAPAVIQLTARLPPIPGAPGCRRGRAQLWINGGKAAEVPLAERWTRASLRLPAESLRPGLNRVTLRWPMPPPVGEQALQTARRRLAEGIEADLHPVFGEVFSLRVRPR
jgi:hypothetical protein